MNKIPFRSEAAIRNIIGNDIPNRWASFFMRYWGFFLLGFVYILIFLPSNTGIDRHNVKIWIYSYGCYLFVLEIASRWKKTKIYYDNSLFRIIRIHFNIVSITALAYISPPNISDYSWFLLFIPLLATLGYFHNLRYLILVYVEVCCCLIFLSLNQGGVVPFRLVTALAECAILGMLSIAIYYGIQFTPKARKQQSLFSMAETLIKTLDPTELPQLIADAAKGGLRTSDGTVIHILGGEDNQTLIPKGSTHIALTQLGRSLMEVGKGIAGHAIADHETINVPDVTKDRRCLPLDSSVAHISSLLVAPMYVEEKNIGTISAHSKDINAFNKQDEEFLTALAHQAASSIAELHGSQERRRKQINQILESSFEYELDQPIDEIYKKITEDIYRFCGFKMSVINMYCAEKDAYLVTAMRGVPEDGRYKLENQVIPKNVMESLEHDAFLIGRSYFVRYFQKKNLKEISKYAYVADLGEYRPGEWHAEDMLITPIQTKKDEILGFISVDNPEDNQLPSFERIQDLEMLAIVAATAIQNAIRYEAAQREIDRRKQAEKERNREQHLMKQFMEYVPDNVYFKDLDSRFIRINRSLATYFGLESTEDAIHKNDFDFFSTEHAEQALKDEREVLRTGKTITKVERETWLNGKGDTWVVTSKMPLYGLDGNIIGSFGISRDITHRREQRLVLNTYLLSVVADLPNPRSLKELFGFIVDKVTQAIPAQDCYLYFCNDGSDHPKLMVHKTGQRQEDSLAKSNMGLVDHTMKACQPLRLHSSQILGHELWDESSWKDLNWDFDPSIDTSLLSVPIINPNCGDAQGVIVIRNADTEYGFTEFDESLLQLIATKAATDVLKVNEVAKVRDESIRTERERLRSGLHSALNTVAIGIKWQVEMLEVQLAPEDRGIAKDTISLIKSACTRSISELTYLLQDLRDPVLEIKGLPAALKSLAAYLCQDGRIIVHSTLVERLSPEFEVLLYRVGQEAIYNAIKHSGYSGNSQVRIMVSLEKIDNQVYLTVKDNGIGFDVGITLESNTKWGLKILKDLINNKHGKLVIDSKPQFGYGTLIQAVVDWVGINSEC